MGRNYRPSTDMKFRQLGFPTWAAPSVWRISGMAPLAVDFPDECQVGPNSAVDVGNVGTDWIFTGSILAGTQPIGLATLRVRRAGLEGTDDFVNLIVVATDPVVAANYDLVLPPGGIIPFPPFVVPNVNPGNVGPVTVQIDSFY